jgi:hypothetical protein
MKCKSIKKYIEFVQARKSEYINFNKQLIVSELAGFLSGITVAEIVSSFSTQSEIAISILSGLADYLGSILGFVAVYYNDNKLKYSDFTTKERFKRIIKSAFCLWPSIAVADIAIIFARPYAHYLLLLSGFEAGIAATIAHLIAAGLFNGIAILSKSIVDYKQTEK